VASKVSPQRLTPGCLVHHQPKGDSWLKLRGQGSNQAMTSGTCYQPEMKWLHFKLARPSCHKPCFKQYVVQCCCPCHYPSPNKWKSMQLNKGHCSCIRPQQTLFSQTPLITWMLPHEQSSNVHFGDPLWPADASASPSSSDSEIAHEAVPQGPHVGVSGAATMDPQGPREFDKDPAEASPPHGPNELLEGSAAASAAGAWM
jgi:hypothetical protein